MPQREHVVPDSTWGEERRDAGALYPGAAAVDV